MSQHIIFPWDVPGWNQLKEKIQEPINSIADFDMRIVNLHNGRYKARTIIDTFNKYYGEHGIVDLLDEKTVVGIIDTIKMLILDGQRTFKGVNLCTLVTGMTSNQSLTRLQVATLIACAFMGLFNYNYISPGKFKMKTSFSDFSLLGIFISSNIFALQCMLRYFANVAEYINDSKFMSASVVIMRKHLRAIPNWEQSNKPISPIYISDKVPDTLSKLSIDYATEWLCQDIFTKSLTHEEIQFLVRPECFVSVLLCSKLEPLDAIAIMGSERMSTYVGIGTNVRYTGKYADNAPYGKSATSLVLQHAVVCIDATHNINGVGQFITDFDRDLNKAFCGASMLQINSPMASGNWCYGAYGGNHIVKFLQLILAASESGKPLIYTPSISDFSKTIDKFSDWVQSEEICVGEVYGMYKHVIFNYTKDPSNRLDNLDIIDHMITLT